MRFEVLDLKHVSPYANGPSKEWIVKHYGDVFGNIFFNWCCQPDFKILNDAKPLLKSQPSDNPLVAKLNKLCYLAHEWRVQRQWDNPLVVTDQKGNYIVHPGQDRYNIMRAFGVTSYNFCLIDLEESKDDIVAKLEKIFNNDGVIQFDQKHLTFRNYRVDPTHYAKWIAQ